MPAVPRRALPGQVEKRRVLPRRAARPGSRVSLMLHGNWRERPLLTALALYAVLAIVRLGGALSSTVLILALLITPVALAVVPRTHWAEVGICPPARIGSLASGVGLTVAAYATTVGAVVLLAGTGKDNWASGILDFLRLGLFPGTTAGTVVDVVAFVIALGIVVPLAEEVFYRGVLHSALEPSVGRWGTVLITASAWALVHLGDYGLNPFNPLVIVTVVPSVFGMGIALGWTRIWTGSALGSAIAQGIANLLLGAWVALW